jgi:hypothetical protein
MDDILTRHANAAGSGIYLAGTPGSSRNYGENLLIFRFTGPDGKGVSCSRDENFNVVNNQAKGAARSKLPLIVNYKTQDLDQWFISPRLPDRARGEQAEFDRPRQGDAELAARELIIGTTRLELLNNFYAASGIMKMPDFMSSYCGKYSRNASMAFYKKFLCQALPDRLVQALAALPQKPLTPDEKQVISAIKDGIKNSDLGSKALDSLFESIDP